MTCLKPEAAAPADTGPNGADFNPFAVMQPRRPDVIPQDFRNGGRVKAADVAPAGVYLPNNNVMTPAMRSPEYVQMSTAAAITLGIMPGMLYRCACTRCLNLLLTYPEGCRANCAYCGLARHREADRDYADRNFIRVDWPAVPMAEIVDKVAADGENTPFHRMCISMITHPRSDDDTVTVLKQWTDRIDPATVPVSILSNPTTMQRADVPDAEGSGRRHLHRGARRRDTGHLRPHPRQGRRQSAQLEEILGNPDGCPGTSSAGRSSAPISSSAWARPSSTC